MRANLCLLVLISSMAACGSDDSGGGGSGGVAGSSGAAGTSGSAGAGGAAGGSGGSAGVDAAPPCAPPTGPGKSAACLALLPENVAFYAQDAAFDGKGVLLVDIFDTPSPDQSTTPVATTVLPDQSGGASEAGLSELTGEPIRFDNLPSSAALYARGVFVDNDAALASGGAPVPGVWFAGVDVSQGIPTTTVLEKLVLTPGQGTLVQIPLLALRKLAVTVKRGSGVTPTGDGQGPIAFAVTDTPALDSSSHLFGYGAGTCADLSGASSFTIDGFVLGTTPRYVAVFLDDLGVGQQGLPEGSLSSLDQSGTIPSNGMLSISADAYAATLSLELTTATPSSQSDNASCGAMDGGSPDAGSSDAAPD